MVRTSIAAVVGCLYVAGSVWLVHSQGKAYREALHRERLWAVETTEAPPPPKHEAKAVPAVTLPEPTPPRPEPAARPAEKAPASQPPKPAGEGTPPLLAQAQPLPAPSVERAPRRPDSNAPGPKTQPPKLDAFWEQPAWKTSWDLARLTAQDEIRIGRELHDLILQLNRPLETGPWLARVEDAAEPFLKTRARNDIPYTFTILDSDAVNVFSHPGGFVYVSRGLFNLIGEEENYALEFAIGHEIAHVDLLHAFQCLRDPEVMKLGAGTLQKLYMMIIPLAYLDEQEFEADKWVYRKMRQLGRTERECLAFLRKLEGYARIHSFENGRGKLVDLGRDSSPLDNHLRAHTAARKRLKHLMELMGKTSSSSK